MKIYLYIICTFSLFFCYILRNHGCSSSPMSVHLDISDPCVFKSRPVGVQGQNARGHTPPCWTQQHNPALYTLQSTCLISVQPVPFPGIPCPICHLCIFRLTLLRDYFWNAFQKKKKVERFHQPKNVKAIFHGCPWFCLIIKWGDLFKPGDVLWRRVFVNFSGWMVVETT